MRNVFWGFGLVILGVLLLLDNLGIADMDYLIHQYWPLILILWGASILIRRKPGYRSPSSGPPPGSPAVLDGDIIHQSQVLGDTEIAVKSQNFMGGSISSVFGDTHVDLTAITIAQGEYTLRIHSVFGNTKVLLPPIAGVSISASSTFGSSSVLGQQKGGFSSFLVATTPEFTTAPNRLKITISKVFGDLYVS